MYLELANKMKLKTSKDAKNAFRLVCCIRYPVGATMMASASIIVIIIVDICLSVKWRSNSLARAKERGNIPDTLTPWVTEQKDAATRGHFRKLKIVLKVAEIAPN